MRLYYNNIATVVLRGLVRCPMAFESVAMWVAWLLRVVVVSMFCVCRWDAKGKGKKLTAAAEIASSSSEWWPVRLGEGTNISWGESNNY